MEELKKLIVEAFVHDINHPGFKTRASKEDMGGFTPKARVGYNISDEHKELSKLHKLPTETGARNKIKNSIEHYTKDSLHINEDLINKSRKKKAWNETEHHVKILNDHISNTPALEKEHHVYSGLGENFNPSEHFKKNNGVIKTVAFTSTSIHPEIAAAFSNHKLPKDQHILHFHLPSGYNKGVYIGHHSTIKEEKEFLLAPNQKWKLTNHEIIDHTNTSREYDHQKRSFVNIETPVKRHIWTVVPHE